jgi:hypothetical protein
MESVMRVLCGVLAVLVMACDSAPTEAVVVRRSAVLACAQPVPCTIVADSSVIWVNGMKYLEIVERCGG